jgi:hypothetical protein
MDNEKLERLLNEVADELGHDVYYVYPDSKRLIPDAVMWAVVVACIVQFLKGFVDFERLGESARTAIAELLDRWRSKKDLEPWIQGADLHRLVLEAFESRPASVTDADLDRGQACLKQALPEFGMDENLAEEHARAIRALMDKALRPKARSTE